MKNITLTLSEGAYLDMVDQIGSAIDELTELSRQVEWYATDLPDLLTATLTLLETVKVREA